jgi:hypothetical protein
MKFQTSYSQTRTYRFTPQQVTLLKTTSRLLGCTESALVRRLLSQGINELTEQMTSRRT